MGIELDLRETAEKVADLVVSVQEVADFAKGWATDPELFDSEDTPTRVLQDIYHDLDAALKKANAP